MGFEEGFGVWSIDVEFKSGKISLVTKETGLKIKQTMKALFIGLMAERIRESGKTWNQNGFSITVMQNSKSRFLHDSNGLPNKANEISSR